MPHLSGMWDWLVELYTGQWRVLAWFGLAILVIYIPAMALYLRHRRRQTKAFLGHNRDAAKVDISRSKVNDLLTVHSVDGDKPILDGKGAHMVFYLTPGEHELCVSYQWTRSSPAAKLVGYQLTTYTTNAPITNKVIRVRANHHGHHKLRFNHDTGDFEFTSLSTHRTRPA